MAALAGAAVAAHGAAPRPPSPPSGAALAALSLPVPRPPLASQRIYFVMTDRCANGDSANDRGGVDGPAGCDGL